jgi:hypothetical protein
MKELFLKLLGIIYYHTGLYLGKYWENQYIQENIVDFRKDWRKNYTKCKKSDRMSFDCYVSISRGIWQSRYGFYRKFNWEKKGWVSRWLNS